MSHSRANILPAQERAFLITIDTEGDNLWGRPRDIQTHNTAYLPRFQDLCEAFGFKPTWLVNYEMAMDPAFVRFARDVIRKNQGEVGMHLHAWNSPPSAPLTLDDHRFQPYLIEYSPEVIDQKVGFMTSLLQDRMACSITSHRAGRWALNTTYAAALARHGYLVDCSVTPHVSWAKVKGHPNGHGGSDYRRFTTLPYMLDLSDISKPGQSNILELPASIIRSQLHQLAPMAYEIPLLRRWGWQSRPAQLWLYPDGTNLRHMLTVVEEALRHNKPYIEFVLHSSELMPGGSPLFPDANSIEHLYRDLQVLFSVIASSFRGRTLSEFRQVWLEAQPFSSINQCASSPGLQS